VGPDGRNAAGGEGPGKKRIGRVHQSEGGQKKKSGQWEKVEGIKRGFVGESRPSGGCQEKGGGIGSFGVFLVRGGQTGLPSTQVRVASRGKAKQAKTKGPDGPGTGEWGEVKRKKSRSPSPWVK